MLLVERSPLVLLACVALAACGDLAPDGTSDAAPDEHALDGGDAFDATLDAGPAPEAAADAPYLDGPVPCDAGGACFATPLALVTGPSHPTLIAVDATNVYFTDGDAVNECAIGGCNDAPTTLWSSTYFYVEGLAAAVGNVYFTAGTQYVASCAAGGCNDKPTNLLTTLSTQFYGFAADDQNVYWDGAGIHACALAGCNETPFTYATPAIESIGLGIDDQWIAWAESGGSVDVCPKSGCASALVAIASSTWAGPVAVAAGIVYWVDQGQPNGGRNVPITKRTNGAILACAATGCGGKPTVLASYPLWLGSGAIVADAKGVYWSLEDVSGTFGEIAGCAASGCSGAPAVYATTMSKSTWKLPTSGLAIDAANLYWTDYAAGAVFQTPR